MWWISGLASARAKDQMSRHDDQGRKCADVAHENQSVRHLRAIANAEINYTRAVATDTTVYYGKADHIDGVVLVRAVDFDELSNT